MSLDSNVPVLVRGEEDGFYYRGTVKEEIEVSDSCCVVVMGMGNRMGVQSTSSPHAPSEFSVAVLISAGA